MTQYLNCLSLCKKNEESNSSTGPEYNATGNTAQNTGNVPFQNGITHYKPIIRGSLGSPGTKQVEMSTRVSQKSTSLQLKHLQDNIYKGRDNVVGIVTHFGLEDSGLEPDWWFEIFSSPHPSRPAIEPTQPPVQWVPGLLRCSKATEAWR